MKKLTKDLGEDERYKAVVEAGKTLVKDMTAVEEALYQTKNRSNQDPLNFPIRLNDKLAGINGQVGFGDYAPTAGARAVHAELTAAIDVQLTRLAEILDQQVPAFNQLVHQSEIPAIRLEDNKE